jgi:hypothetical protein
MIKFSIKQKDKHNFLCQPLWFSLASLNWLVTHRISSIVTAVASLVLVLSASHIMLHSPTIQIKKILDEYAL